jgi:hypothetical protein
MNGISSNLLEEIQKGKDKNGKERLKFISAIILTNLMVASLCYSSKQSVVKTALPKKIYHLDHQMMVIPLTTLVSVTDERLQEIPVKLISTDKKIIVTKAWLHEAVKTNDEKSHFKIEIKNQDIARISEFIEKGIIAVPYVETKSVLKTISRGSKYEVSI